MNIEELLSLPESEWLTELQIDPVEDRDIDANISYYKGAHPILTDPSRADYTNKKYKLDQDGQRVKDANGVDQEDTPEAVKRTRLILNYPHQIVETAVGMTVGNPVTLVLNEGDETAFAELVDQWRNKTRLDTFAKTMSRALFVESKCAELFFIDIENDPDKDIKVKLLSKENGDEIWAHFNDDGGMDALTRGFTKRAVVDGKAVDIEVVQIYTAAALWEQEDGGKFIETKNPYEKIQIVYYDQKRPEYHLVTDLINKQEVVRSQNSDVNKKIGSPGVVVAGSVAGMPDTDQDVKVWQAEIVDDGAGGKIQSSVKYLQAEGAPEAIKMELEEHQKDMYKMSWPDLSRLRDDANTGNLSGTAIKLMFVDAFVKVGNKREIFEDFSRRVAVLKKMMAVSRGRAVFEDLNITVQFNSILPTNLNEMADMWLTAVQGEFTSKEHAANSFTPNDGNPNVLDQIETEQGLAAGTGE